MDIPEDWSDAATWDRYFSNIADTARPVAVEKCDASRFLDFAKKYGERVWFPGCGLDASPRLYAETGCSVLATDISRVAVGQQNEDAARPARDVFSGWSSYLEQAGLSTSSGRLVGLVQDFTATGPSEKFDVVINRRAFSQLPPNARKAAAKCFFSALRPGGIAIIDTLNVQGRERDAAEDALLEAGFYIPFWKSERWYRDHLENTGIIYAMILGRPIVPYWEQYPADRFEEFRARDMAILESFRAEYEERCEAEAGETRTRMEDPTVVAAHVIYSTG